MSDYEILTVSPDLTISLDVECPYCGHEYDLVKCNMANGEYQLYNQIFRFDKEKTIQNCIDADITCPSCEKEFKSKGINW